MAAPLVEVIISGDATQFVASLDSAAGAAESAVGQLDTASAGLSGALDTAGGSADTLAGSLSTVSGTVESTAGAFDTAAATMDGSLGTVAGTADKLDATLLSIGESLDTSTAMMQADTTLMMADIDKQMEGWDKLIASIDDVGPTVDAASVDARGALDLIQEKVMQLSGQFGLAGDAAKAMADSIGESAAASDAELETTQAAAGGVGGTMATVGKAGAAALVVVGVAAIDLGMKYQSLTTNVAAMGGISVTQASVITRSFASMALGTIYNGSQVTKAYAGVVGQLTAVEGHTLNSAQANQVMSAAMNLAEGSGTDLSSATSALSSVMQTFKLKTQDATNASDTLFSTAKDSGVQLGAVAKSVTQVHTQLGILTPKLSDTGALLVDMVQQGMNGSRALRVLGSAMTSLLKPNTTVVEDQNKLKQAFNELPPSLQETVAAFQNHKISLEQVQSATANLNPGVQALWATYQKAQSAVATSTLTLKDSGDAALYVNGKFVGLGAAIGILHNQTAGKTLADQQAILQQDGLGSSANKLLPIIDAGSKAFERSQREVTADASAKKAAEKQAQTLAHQIEAVKQTVEGLVTILGTYLVPILQTVGSVIFKVTDFFIHHKAIALALALVIGGVMVGAFVALAVAMAPVIASLAVMAAGALVAAAPFLAIGAAIGAVIFIAIEFHNQIIHFFEDVIKWITGHWKDLLLILGGPFTLILGVVMKFHNDIINWVMDVINWVRNHWQLLLPILTGPFGAIIAVVLHFKTQIIGFFQDIPAAVSGVINSIVGFFTAMPGQIVTGMGDVVGTIFAAFSSAGTWITNNVITPVVQFFTALPGQAFNALGNAVGTIFADLLQAGTWVVSNVITPVVSWFSQLPGKIANAIGDLVSIGVKFITSLWNGISSFAGTMLSDIGSFVSTNIVGGIGDLYNKGISIIQGLWNGINSVGSWLYNNIVNFVKSHVEGAITSFFSMFSPSRRMAMHGMNIALGLAQGILAGAGAVSSASTAMANAALMGTTGSMGIGNITAGSIGATKPGGSSASSSGPITLALNIDGQKFASAVMNPLQSQALRGQKTGGQFAITLQ